MKIANINSKRHYYVTKDGVVLNSKYEVVNGSLNKKYDLRILSYTDLEGKEKQIPYTRLFYKTFYPDQVIDGCTIIRKDKTLPNTYILSNLEKIPNSKMTHFNNMIELGAPHRQVGGDTFYEDFTELQRNHLFTSLRLKRYSVKFLAKKLKTSETSIRRLIKRENLWK